MDWKDIGISAGIKELATYKKSLAVDWTFVGRHFYLGTKHFFDSPLLSLKSYGIGTGFGLIIVPKTVLYPIF